VVDLFGEGKVIATFEAVLQPDQVGRPVGAAVMHELVGLAPVGVGEEQRRI
jgi:hypothetical protein